jgi:hydrogenase expression/formation protein HypC
MCLAVPGKIVEIRNDPERSAVGTVGTIDFQGTRVEASLVFTPEANLGDWVLVHAGYALSVLDEAEARETWKYLEFEDLEEIESAARRSSAAEQEQ